MNDIDNANIYVEVAFCPKCEKELSCKGLDDVSKTERYCYKCVKCKKTYYDKDKYPKYMPILEDD